VTDKDDFMEKALKLVKTASKLKDKLIELGKTKGRCICPWCGNTTFTGILHVQRRDKRGYHIHCACVHPGCGAQILE
jgi:hypothetical protein